jgi:TonB-dependent starch-binding outer membrane protein SusC
MKKTTFIKRFIFLLCIFLPALNLTAQEVTLTGKVVDQSTGEPLPGAGVVIKGTTTGVSTDLDGNFAIHAKQADTLVISFIGYIEKEVPVGSQQMINVQLSPETIGMDEVVVIGYGTVKKEDATGAVSVVSSKDFNQGNITSPQELLVGKSTGVIITTKGGSPTDGSTIRIRGGSSLNASNDPLIVVDGVPITNKDVSGNSNILSFINPSDIESFTVLKDASATAIYGSRASNGVIIITTKKGKAGGKLTLSYNGSVSVSTPVDFIELYSGDEFRKIANEKRSIFDPLVYDKLGTENTDWQKEIFRNAISHDHNLSFSGAYKFLPYRFSVGYTDQNGILKNTDMQRLTAALNLNPTLLKDALKINVNSKVMSTKNNFGDKGAIGSAISMDPTQPVKDNNSSTAGYFQWPTYGSNLGTPNPVEQALAVDNRSDVIRFVGNIQADYTLPFLPDLRANLNLATDYADGSGHNNRPVTSPSTLTTPYIGKLNDFNSTNTNNLLDFYLNYVKELGTDHKIDATAGYSWQHFKRDKDNYTRAVVDTMKQTSDSSAFVTENYLVSFFGRLNYSFLNRYLLTGTVRYDGSSRFAKNNRWGLFPSVAFAWKINEESFLQDIDIISDLKLRLGWGITGQQDIGNDYPAQALYIESREGNYYPIGGVYLPTLRPNAYDPDIKWEETTTQNIGLDFGFYNNRVTGSVDIYKRVTDDLLNKVTIPSGSNFSNTLLTNVGSLENKGVEVTLNLIPVSTKDISLNLGFNFTYNENKITKLLFTDDPEYVGVLIGEGSTGQNQVHRVGYAASSFFVNQQVYSADGNPIEGLYVDFAGKGGIVNGDNENKYIYHNPAPDYQLGFSFRFSYKNLDLSGSARSNIGNYVYNQVASGSSYDQMQQIGYWKNMPKYLNETNFVKRQFTSDYFVENASFLKLDNISAGYNFPDIVDKMNLRVNFAVNNVFTVTKYSGIDPEVEGGIDNNFYPRPRTFTLGLSLTY